jgi:hypothetical protein
MRHTSLIPPSLLPYSGNPSNKYRNYSAVCGIPDVVRELVGAFLASMLPAVCCASRTRPQKIGFQPIFYSTNCVQTKGLRSPIIGDFLRHQTQKIHKCNRLLGERPDKCRNKDNVEGPIAKIGGMKGL